MRILEEVYEMPGCPEEMEEKCEIWWEVKQCETVEMAEVETLHGPKLLFCSIAGWSLNFLDDVSSSMIIDSILR
jgi:hypothetical protein